jgi:hypothetical protein
MPAQDDRAEATWMRAVGLRPIPYDDEAVVRMGHSEVVTGSMVCRISYGRGHK